MLLHPNACLSLHTPLGVLTSGGNWPRPPSLPANNFHTTQLSTLTHTCHTTHAAHHTAHTIRTTHPHKRHNSRALLQPTHHCSPGDLMCTTRICSANVFQHVFTPKTSYDERSSGVESASRTHQLATHPAIQGTTTPSDKHSCTHTHEKGCGDQAPPARRSLEALQWISMRSTS